MEYEYNVCPEYATFTVRGLFISGEEADNLYALVREQIKNGTKKIIFDLEKVDYINSMIVGFLIKINDELNELSGKVVLCNVQTRVLEIFKVTKVNLILPIFENKEKAIEYLKQS